MRRDRGREEEGGGRAVGMGIFRAPMLLISYAVTTDPLEPDALSIGSHARSL